MATRGGCLNPSGEDCWVNCALQCTARDAELCRHVRRAVASGPVTAALGAALAQLADAPPADPTALRAAVAATAPQLARGPGDPSEFLEWLLAGLHDEARQGAERRPSPPPPPPPPAARARAASATAAAAAQEAWAAYRRREGSAVAELRYGMLRDDGECSGCRQDTSEFRPFAALTVGVLPGGGGDGDGGAAQRLQPCIEAWRAPAPSTVFCAGCDDFCGGTRRRSVSRLPPVLTIHVQRAADPWREVVCPLVLHPRELGHGSDEAAAQPPAHRAAYELFAVSHQLRADDGSSHFFSCCRVRGPRSAPPPLPRQPPLSPPRAQSDDGGWLRLDDGEVTAVSAEDVRTGILTFACYKLVEGDG